MTVVSAVASLNLALPSIARDFGASQTQLTWIVDAYTVVMARLVRAIHRESRDFAYPAGSPGQAR